MFIRKYDFKQIALSGIVLISVLCSGIAVNTYAQENKPADQSAICKKIKDNLKAKFDLNKEKQEATPFKLQAFLNKKIQQSKTQGGDTSKLGNIPKEFTDKLNESQASYNKLFEIFEKIKTTDCSDTKDFQELMKEAKDILPKVRTESMAIVIDAKRELSGLIRPNQVNQKKVDLNNSNSNKAIVSPSGSQ